VLHCVKFGFRRARAKANAEKYRFAVSFLVGDDDDRLYVLGLEPLYEEHPDIAPPELEFEPCGKKR